MYVCVFTLPTCMCVYVCVFVYMCLYTLITCTNYAYIVHDSAYIKSGYIDTFLMDFYKNVRLLVTHNCILVQSITYRMHIAYIVSMIFNTCN